MIRKCSPHNNIFSPCFLALYVQGCCYVKYPHPTHLFSLWSWRMIVGHKIYQIMYSNYRYHCGQGILLQFSHSVVSDSLWPHGLQHARPPCPLPTPRAYSNSCPLSRWCHPAISSSSSPSPPALKLSQHQSLFKWVSSSYQVAKVLESQL